MAVPHRDVEELRARERVDHQQHEQRDDRPEQPVVDDRFTQARAPARSVAGDELDDVA